MLQTFPAVPTNSRRPTVPPSDPKVETTGTNPPAVNDELVLVKKGDIIDVGLNWGCWLEANGGKLKTSSWAAHGSSPKTPTFTGGTAMIDGKKIASVVLLDLGTAAAGDIYWLRNTVVIEGVLDGTFTMPDRTLSRVLYVKVVL